MRVELVLERDNDDIHPAWGPGFPTAFCVRPLGPLTDVGGNLANVGVVQSSVNLVKNEKGCRLVGVRGLVIQSIIFC